MEDLLQSQIRDSFRLALPEGLKDLMADISREVLRAQPQNLYQFIANYLSVLLVAREHLFVASRVCDDLCKDQCWRELEDELRQLSMSEEDVKETLKVVAVYFSSDEVNEGNLLQTLTQKTNVDEKELPAVQDAIRCAYLRHRLGSTAPDESQSADELDETTIAAKHTLKIYQKATEELNVNYDCVAAKIQAAYRANNVRRNREQPAQTQFRKSNDKVRFIDKKERLTADLFKKCASKCSSMSLAGSFVDMPLYSPYSVAEHPDHEVDDVGDKERERINIDYVADADARERQVNGADKKAKKSISFHSLLRVVEVDYHHDHDHDEVVDEADEAHYESDDSDEELVVVEEAIGEVSRDSNEKQGNDDDVTETNTGGFIDETGNEDQFCGSDSSVEDSDDNNDPLLSEMQRISKIHVHASFDAQANIPDNAQTSPLNKQTNIAVNTHDESKQYSFEIRPDDDDKNLKQLVRAVSSEIKKSKSPANAKRSSISGPDSRDDHAEDVEKRGRKKIISFHSLPQVVEVDFDHEVEDVADEADNESEEIEEDVIDVIEERMIKVSGNLDEQQDDGDDLAKTDSLVVSELADDESDLIESSLEENNDDHNLEQSEMERVSKMALTQFADDVQAHSLSIAQVIDSSSVNSDEGDEQYRGTSFEIIPDDDITLDLLRAVSQEIEEITNNQIKE